MTYRIKPLAFTESRPGLWYAPSAFGNYEIRRYAVARQRPDDPEWDYTLTNPLGDALRQVHWPNVPDAIVAAQTHYAAVLAYYLDPVVPA